MMIWLDAITENLSGPLRLRVNGRSMLPTLRPGDEVVVHPVTAEALEPGDWVVVRNAQGAFLHRYLGRRDGAVVTKGDGHRALDPLWPSDAVLGRVVEAQRDGRCFYRRTPGRLRREKVLAAGHHVLGDVWSVLRRVKALLLALCMVARCVCLGRCDSDQFRGWCEFCRLEMGNRQRDGQSGLASLAQSGRQRSWCGHFRFHRFAGRRRGSLLCTYRHQRDTRHHLLLLATGFAC